MPAEPYDRVSNRRYALDKALQLHSREYATTSQPSQPFDPQRYEDVVVATADRFYRFVQDGKTDQAPGVRDG